MLLLVTPLALLFDTLAPRIERQPAAGSGLLFGALTLLLGVLALKFLLPLDALTLLLVTLLTRL
jgi:hypothetical protein